MQSAPEGCIVNLHSAIPYNGIYFLVERHKSTKKYISIINRAVNRKA